MYFYSVEIKWEFYSVEIKWETKWWWRNQGKHCLLKTTPLLLKQTLTRYVIVLRGRAAVNRINLGLKVENPVKSSILRSRN